MTHPPSQARREPEGDRALREVRWCGFKQYATVIKACDSELPLTPTATEQRLWSELAAAWDGKLTPAYHRTLLFGDLAKRLSNPERAALIKLVRRGLIRIWLMHTSDPNSPDAVSRPQHLWEFVAETEPGAASQMIVEQTNTVCGRVAAVEMTP